MSFLDFRLWLTPDGGPETLIVPDGLMREIHTDQAQPTQFPIGRSSVVTDHVQQAPALYSCELLISDAPIAAPETQGREGWQYVARPTSIGDNKTVDIRSPSAPLGRTRRVYRELRRAQRGGIPLRINSTMRVYRNMVIVGLDVPREFNATDVLIAIDFVEIRRARSQEVLIEVVAETKLKSKTNRGNQEATQLPDPEITDEGPGESLLFAGRRALGG